MWAGVGCGVCTICFLGYLFIQYRKANADDGEGALAAKQVAVIIDKVKGGGYNLLAALGDMGEQGLLGSSDKVKKQMLADIVRVFFDRYDRNNDKTIDHSEFCCLLSDLHINIPPKERDAVWDRLDTDGSGTMDFKEFVGCCEFFAKDKKSNPERYMAPRDLKSQRGSIASAEDDDEDEEEEEMPEEFADLPVEEQQQAIMKKAFTTMGLGTFLVLIFSDPMVDVLNETGDRMGVPAFYISFILAPLASNASELIASYVYAQKKTSKTITISMVQLEGAAIMNNTFCLLIFYVLVYAKGLAWEFTAETIVIVGVQLFVGLIALTMTKQTLFIGCIIATLYPLSLLTVWSLENIFGFD